MSKTITTKFAKLVLNTDDILKDINLNEFLRRKDAAKYAVKVMKKNVGRKGVSSPGNFPSKRTGLLRRKIGMQHVKDDKSTKVGSKDFKAHLLEFGHGDGKERNKRPFVMPSLRQAEPEIIKIMSREYF